MVSLGAEVTRVYRALLLRGAFDARGGRVRAARILLVMLLPTAMERADHLADALALRGFEGRIPLPRPWRPRLVEAPFYAIALTASAAGVWEKLPWIRSLFASTT
jgi:energy-coupling factor transporter transmembrane protein EcfT